MLYQIIIAAGLAVFLVNLILNFRKPQKTERKSQKSPVRPLLSVLVPARDEEANIGACLESLQKQDYPNYEILVLDDNSIDRTAGIVTGMAARDRRIKLIRANPSPTTGRASLCLLSAGQRARGEWLLFVDADTMHAPHMLRRVLELALNLKSRCSPAFPASWPNLYP